MNTIKRMVGAGAMLLLPAFAPSTPIFTPISGVMCLAQQAQPQDDGAALMKQAEALEKANKIRLAAVAYGQAAKAFEAQGQHAEAANALEKSVALHTRMAETLRDTAAEIVKDNPALAASAYGDAAKEFEAAGKYQQAAVAYGNAAKIFEAQGQHEKQADALEKSATMYEKWADQLAKGGAPAPQPAPNPALPANPAPADNPPPVAPPANPAPAGATPLPLEASAIVSKNAKGQPAVAAKNGKPIEGIKLSRHDTDIHSPSIAVAPDGTIHVAFVEQRAEAPYTVSVYHRSSSDGGKTWSEVKNLSESLPGYNVGNCQVAVDGASRAYVIWHTGVAEGYYTDMDAHSGASNNLVYRVLSGGAWSKPVFIPPVHSKEDENDADASWFVAVDSAGKVHVVWNMLPYSRHPESWTGAGGHKWPSTGIGASMVMQADLNGTDPGTPREIYCAKIAPAPNDPQHNPGSDHFDTLDGYVDAAGQAHFIAHVSYAGVGPTDPNHRIHLIENGKQTPVVNLPNLSFNIWRYPPKLLLDAKGRQHIIAMYEAGEQPNIRDYIVGSDDEPTVIRAAKEVKGTIIGFEAYQGPGGRMVVLMQMNDTGNDTDDELYLSTSDGGPWTTPVNITNNTGRQSFVSTQTSIASHVATYSYWYPGPAAAAYDRQGHLVLAYISNERSAVQSVALGWTLAGGSTKTPKLLFLRF